ncbi:hypothetical protein, partial [Enterococcus moraviensis]
SVEGFHRTIFVKIRLLLKLSSSYFVQLARNGTSYFVLPPSPFILWRQTVETLMYRGLYSVSTVYFFALK